MPRYYCDYCDTYLTHDSPSVRKQHNAGYKHKANVRTYYQQFEEQQTQSLIDQRIKEHLGQAAAFQAGAPFSPHMLAFPGARPRLPILPTPGMPHGFPQAPGAPLMPGVRPPILPAPGIPGYPGGPPTMPQPGAPPGSMPQPGAPPGSMPQPGAPLGSMPQPGAPLGSMPQPGAPPGSMPMQMAPRPPTLPPPTSGVPGAPIPNSAAPPAIYQANPQAPAGLTSGAPPAPPTAPQPVFSYAQPSEGNQ